MSDEEIRYDEAGRKETTSTIAALFFISQSESDSFCTRGKAQTVAHCTCASAMLPLLLLLILPSMARIMELFCAPRLFCTTV
jgi:hypothetical protein